MISAGDLINEMKNYGYDFFTGVPCSFLTPLINHVICEDNLDYVAATSEGEAVAIAAGAWLSGKKTIVMCQNSGLGNMVNPITSLNYIYKIPSLLVITWRGMPGLNDEPQHELMGTISQKLLDLIQVENMLLPRVLSDIKKALSQAEKQMGRSSLPFAFILEKGLIEKKDIGIINEVEKFKGEEKVFKSCDVFIPSRIAVLGSILKKVTAQTAIIATTGKCGRELFSLEDRKQHFYMVGSMGGGSAMGLGVAINSNKPVVVLDGDGAAMMKMGNLATIGAHKPKNFLHIILDNGVYDSTGGQPSCAKNVDFAVMAINCGYRYSAGCNDLTSFEEAIDSFYKQKGPMLIHMKIKPGSVSPLGRPTLGPKDVAKRFKKFLSET